MRAAVEPLAKVTVNYRWSAGAHFDHAYYGSKHMQIARELLRPLGVVRLESNRTVLDKAPKPGTVVATATAYFASVAAAQAAVAAAGASLLADVPNYSNIRPELHISDVAVHYEDAANPRPGALV